MKPWAEFGAWAKVLLRWGGRVFFESIKRVEKDGKTTLHASTAIKAENVREVFKNEAGKVVINPSVKQLKAALYIEKVKELRAKGEPVARIPRGIRNAARKIGVRP